jgi:hypothetical protein
VNVSASLPRTVTLDSKTLDSAIEVLSRAAESFRLTRRESLSYRALVSSVDLSLASFVVLLVSGPTSGFEGAVFFSAAVIWLLSSFVGILTLALNIPVIRKTFREGRELKALGLHGLSKSLWKAGRRNPWVGRARGALYIVVGATLLLTAYVVSVPEKQLDELDVFVVIFLASAGVLLFGTRYVRNQRERMDLSTSAEGLTQALKRLRLHPGKSKDFAVPSQLLEQVAAIEAAQIAKERKDAVLQSIGSHPTGYSITFDPGAAEHRASLDVADRIELEDIVAQLSAGTMESTPQTESGLQAQGPPLRATSASERVEVQYAVDGESRSIRITAVDRIGNSADRVGTGANHA